MGPNGGSAASASVVHKTGILQENIRMHKKEKFYKNACLLKERKKI
jgi:hypothetical protein